MIEIITEQVNMPSLSSKRRFQKICVGGDKFWEVIDSHSNNETVFKGSFEIVSLACHNLNKKYYRDIVNLN